MASVVTGETKNSVDEARPCNVYRDVFGSWRWECTDAHGDMRDSVESFDTYEEALSAAQRAGLTPGPY